MTTTQRPALHSEGPEAAMRELGREIIAYDDDGMRHILSGYLGA